MQEAFSGFGVRNRNIFRSATPKPAGSTSSDVGLTCRVRSTRVVLDRRRSNQATASGAFTLTRRDCSSNSESPNSWLR